MGFKHSAGGAAVCRLMMKEHPILFSGLMVQAILDGRKTQTRRIIKPQPEADDCGFWFPSKAHKKKLVYETDESFKRWLLHSFRCPYGQPGDRLWVRETFVNLAATTPDGILTIRPGDKIIRLPEGFKSCDGRYKWSPFDGEIVSYQADGDIEFCDGDGFSGEWADRSDMPRWKPSIHMPRWASRITLEITGVRVERLQDISEADVKAEGINPETNNSGRMHRALYRELWNQLNAKRGYGWDANPWVWVIEFKRVYVGQRS